MFVTCGCDTVHNTEDVLLFFALAGLNQGQEGPSISSPSSIAIIQRQPTSVSKHVAWAAEADVENAVVEIQCRETSLSPFSNEFPDRQTCSQL